MFVGVLLTFCMNVALHVGMQRDLYSFSCLRDEVWYTFQRLQNLFFAAVWGTLPPRDCCIL